MRAKDKPFVVYRRPGFFTFVPQGIKGWSQLSLWLALGLAFVIWFIDHLASKPEGSEYHFGILLFVIFVAAWVIGGIWLVFAHAQFVDMTVLMRDKQRAERKKQRQAK